MTLIGILGLPFVVAVMIIPTAPPWKRLLRFRRWCLKHGLGP